MPAQGSLVRRVGRWERVLTGLEWRFAARRGEEDKFGQLLLHHSIIGTGEKLGWDSLFAVGMRGGARWNVVV